MLADFWCEAWFFLRRATVWWPSVVFSGARAYCFALSGKISGPAAEGDCLTLACTSGELKSVYRVLRAVMDYGYEHECPARVRLVCADEDVYRAYTFQWNMWFAERKPEHDESKKEV